MDMEERLVEKIAVEMAEWESLDPYTLYYLDSYGYRVSPLPKEMIGLLRKDGTEVKQYESVPRWRFEYGAIATAIAHMVLKNFSVTENPTVELEDCDEKANDSR